MTIKERYDGVLRYFRATGGPKSRVFLVHGEPECTAAMQEALRAVHTGEVNIAKLDSVVTV